MPVNNPGTLQTVTENGNTTNIQSVFKNATNDIAGLVTDTTDTTGFAQCQLWRLGGADALYYGTIFGFNGFINLLNNSFFFGNSNALNFYLINTALNVHTLSVNGNNYNFYQTYLDLGAKDLQTTGTFTDGITPIVSGHTHTGTGNEGAVIPHVTTTPVRALDTVYKNTGLRAILVIGNIQSDVKNPGDQAFVTVYTDSSSPPTTPVLKSGQDWITVAALSEQITSYFPFTFVVQPNDFYSITTTTVGSGVVTLGYWNETPL